MRRPLIAVAAGVVGLAAAHTLAWRFAEQRLAQGFDDWAAAQRGHGWTVTYGAPAAGGWPLEASLNVPDMFLAGGEPAMPGGLTWSADHVALSWVILHPRTLSIGLEGMQRLRIGEGPDIPYTADHLAAVIPLDPGAPPREVDVEATNLRVGVPQGGTPAGGLTIALLHAHLDSRPAAAQGEPVLAFTGSAQDIGLPPPHPGQSWPLGPRIASVSLDAVLNGPMPRAPVLETRAEGWRDGGGTFEIKRLALGWGPLGLSGTATLALDDHLQPMGVATAHVRGQTATIDALAAGHLITADTATAAKAVLGLMARAPEGGGDPEVEAPLTLQNRTLSMGRIPLTKLPPLVWPEATLAPAL